MTTTDANGHKKDFLADAFGRTIRVREYQNNALYATTQYGYDPLDRLTTTTDNANNVTTLTYDWLGRKTQMQDPDMGNWAYAYDNAGNLTEQHDARGNSVCFAYDALNRATTKTARTGTSCASSPVAYTVTFGYDDITNNNKGLGRRTSLSDSFGNNQTWKYDLQGRVVSTAQTIPGAPATYTTYFTYDAMDRVRTMTYPDGEVVTTSYNAQGLPDTLNGANSYVSATTYNAASQLDSLTFGNGAATDYTYNPNNLRLTDIVTTKSGNTLLNLHYTFDNVGNILSVVDTARGETTNYSYDDLNRLMSASITTGGNQYSRSWQYDSIGNMTQRVENGVTTSYQYNDATSKHAVTHLNNVLKYQYDPNGNMTTRDGDTLVYDVENRLTSVTKAGVTTSFVYNGDGTRVKREVMGVGTTYYIGNYFEVWVPNGGSATFNKYYYFGAQRVAAKIGADLFYLQGDHLASSSVVMTQAGTSFYSRQTYFPFGAQRTTEGSALPTDYTFTGQKNDASTDLMFYGARYYDTTLGRFTQPDTIVPNPMDPQSLNRYSYVRNNTVNRIDPTGHEDEPEPACQSWDTWCWENRWYTAHGYCYSDKTEEWTRACKPSFLDPDIAAEVGASMLEDASFGRIVDFKKYFDQLVEAAVNAVSPQVAIAYESILAAFAAVGEVNGFCGPDLDAEICTQALASIPLAAKSRLYCNTTSDSSCFGQTFYKYADKTIAQILTRVGKSGGYSDGAFQGLSHWIDGTVSFSNEKIFSIFYKALSVSEQVFTENYIEDGLASFVERFGVRPWFQRTCGATTTECLTLSLEPFEHNYWLK
jgi:RHS repeat-associated protein